MSILLALLPALLSPAPQAPAATAPPGTVLIAGGRTKVGIDKKDVEALLQSDPQAELYVRVLDAQTPQSSQSVDDFYLMVSEVTNEQYLEFVRATGHRPPFTWGHAAVTAAGEEFLKADALAHEKARAENKSYERKKWDTQAQERWWSANWHTSEWEMPERDARRPVTYVDFSDAEAYCLWAGLRLPSELEFQRAVRRNGDGSFPWGEDAIEGRAATSELRANTPFEVGHFAEGATPDGIVDLVGNVWEWTTSPYTAYPNFKRNTYEIGEGKDKKKLEPIPQWDGNSRISVGGSFQNPSLAARATTRMSTERTQMTNALGFRCAATPAVGVDVSRAVYHELVRNSPARGDGIAFLADQVVALDGWESRVPEATGSGSGPPKGYGVITAYRYLVFVPVSELPDSDLGPLGTLSRTVPVQLGFLSSSMDFIEPALPAGTYIVAYRAKGDPPRHRPPAAEGEGKVRAQDPLDEQDPLLAAIDIKRDNLLFFDAVTGELALAIEPTGVRFDKVRELGSTTFYEKKDWEDQDGEQVRVTSDWLRVDVNVPTKVRNRALTLTLELQPPAGAATKEWRR